MPEVIEPKRIADRHHPLADLQGVRVTKIRGSETGLGIDFNHGDIGFLVAADNFGLVLLIVGELDDDLGGVLDDVIIGKNRTIAIDDKTRT
jgi:hypothetical protein